MSLSRVFALLLCFGIFAGGCSRSEREPPGRSCADGQRRCGDSCADLRSDPAHCGACDVACPPGAPCVDGSCGAACEEGQSPCEGACVLLAQDPRHCGACGAACADGAICREGSCEAACPAGQGLCAGRCVDLAVDPSHCGACGEACDGGSRCEGGTCVCPGLELSCGGGCVNPRVDTAHCGGCDLRCPSGASCAAGRCTCPEGQAVCEGACVHLPTDPAHCGGCGVACGEGLHATVVCHLGACFPVCDEGFASCGGGLDCETHIAGDPANCGACGLRCADLPGLLRSEGCLNGQCVFECEAGLANCSGNPADGCETDLRLNPRHCAGCGNDCSALANVAASTCTEVGCRIDACASSFGDCDGKPRTGCEADLSVERAHCGACDRACQTGCTPEGCLEVVAFDASYNHVCALLSNGTSWCWGYNSAGQLGVGTASTNSTWSAPTRVEGLAAPVAVVAAFEHTCAIDGAGELWCWGSNRFGQMGLSGPSNTLAPIPGPLLPPGGGTAEELIGLDIDGEHSCAVLESGSVWCWGLNDEGQLGAPSANGGAGAPRHSEAPVRVEGLPPVAEVGLGNKHTCARTAGGEVWCWGGNGDLQRGDAGEEARHQPAKVHGIAGVRQLAVGYRNVCALVEGGALWCWGKGDSGALGNGATTSSAAPVQVQGLSEVAQASCGTDFCCAVQTSGALWCWGANSYGGLGNGSYASSAAPVRVAFPNPVDRVSAGGSFACARSDGQLWCWGHNYAGQLGIGTNLHQTAPARVVWPGDSTKPPPSR